MARKMPGNAPPITPLKLPSRVRTVIVFGGSFDPPHIYHTLGPLTVAGTLYGRTAWVLYVPAARSPLKKRGPTASDDHRLAMLKLALDLPGSRSVWTDEIDRAAWLAARGRDEPSYTIDTLRRLRKVVPDRVTLRLLIGADQAADFHKWKNPREIIRVAEPLVMPRDPISTVNALHLSLRDKGWTRAERAAWCTRLAPGIVMPAASTGVRPAIPGAPTDARKWLKQPPLDEVTTRVARYIIEHNLYEFRKGDAKPAPADVRQRRPLGDTKEGRDDLNREGFAFVSGSGRPKSAARQAKKRPIKKKRSRRS